MRPSALISTLPNAVSTRPSAVLRAGPKSWSAPRLSVSRWAAVSGVVALKPPGQRVCGLGAERDVADALALVVVDGVAGWSGLGLQRQRLVAGADVQRRRPRCRAPLERADRHAAQQ